MKLTLRYAAGLAAAALCSVAAASGPASAQTGKAYFADKSITYIVSTAPAGGYDTYGRLVSEYMQKHLPGSTFVVRNMPGAGHLVGANVIALSKPDGLTIGTFNTGLIYNQLVKLEGMKFDLAQLSWIGKAASEPRILVVSTQSGIGTYDDLANSKVPISFATAGVGSSAYVESVMLLKALKLPATVKTGYNGTEDMMAMRRGEIGAGIASRSSYVPFVANGYGKFIAQIGGTEKDLPQLITFAKDDTARALITLVQSLGDIARLTVGPPGIPADRLAALREAYKQSLEDPELRAKAAKLNIPIEPLYGDDALALIKKALVQPPETIELLKASLEAPK
jgi:tripartite-type tricarboxylate transporter receptor subunit TctC